jgi:multiple antibiotic resistance protein
MNFAFFITMTINLFLIVDPIGCMPLFATITKDDPPRRRRAMILRAVAIAFVVLVFFALVGQVLLDYFGVEIPAVRIAGGVLLFIIGMEMLYGRLSRTETTEHEEQEALGKTDVSITPLAIPFLAGPGSIAAVVLFAGLVDGPRGLVLLIAAVALVMLVSLVLLSVADRLLGAVGQIGIRVIARIMGLLLLFVAVQFVIDGLRGVGLLSGP